MLLSRQKRQSHIGLFVNNVCLSEQLQNLFLFAPTGRVQNAVNVLLDCIVLTELLFELAILGIQRVLFSGKAFVFGFELCRIGELAGNAGRLFLCTFRTFRTLKNPSLKPSNRQTKLLPFSRFAPCQCFQQGVALTNPHSSANLLWNNDPAQVVNTSDDSCCLHIVLNPFIYCRMERLRRALILSRPAFLFDKQCYHFRRRLVLSTMRSKRPSIASKIMRVEEVCLSIRYKYQTGLRQYPELTFFFTPRYCP